MVTVTGWVTPDDLKKRLAVPGPWTADDEAIMQVVVNAVNAYIVRVRPDLVPPTANQPATGPALIAFNPAFNPAFNGSTTTYQQGTIFLAAVELAHRWWLKRGEEANPTYGEFGSIPTSVDKDIAELLEIGRSHEPLVG
jgi:hypothetical protein